MKNLILIMLLFYCSTAIGQEKSIIEDPSVLKKVLKQTNVWNKKIFVGNSKNNLPIYAYYYNKGASDKAMIIAGVHGSEFYGVDVANSIKDSLDKMKPKSFKWAILVVPEIFADNVVLGRSNSPKRNNYGRTSCTKCNGKNDNCDLCVDPNRQMPPLHSLYQAGDLLSMFKDTIDIENRYLLTLAQLFNPTRIASLHCKHQRLFNQIGIYADPRTDNKNIALGFEEDERIVFDMANLVKLQNGKIYGNFKTEGHQDFATNAIYPKDSNYVKKGEKQYRSYEDKGSKGMSFGTWASSEIWENGILKKNAAKTFTFELPQFYSFLAKDDDITSLKKEEIDINTRAYKNAIIEIFLSQN